MRFPRNVRIFRGHLDATPLASMFFLLLTFVLLGSLVYTPGVRIELPRADNLPGSEGPAIAVAVDAAGHFYFANQLVNSTVLRAKLREAAATSPAPLTLVVQADKAVPQGTLIDLQALASEAGIHSLLLATLPPATEPFRRSILSP